MVLYIIVGLLLFGLLIAVHEGGHFLAAKGLGVQVNEFSVGMGPAILSRQRGETVYSLRALPLGGYCAMEGEEEDSQNPRSFSRKPAWRKFIILAAGSGMNFLAGFLLVVVLFASAGSFAVPVIRDFAEGFPYAGEEGLQRGDRILSVNGHRVSTYSEAVTQLSAAAGAPMDLVVEREGERVALHDLPLQPREYTVEGERVTMYGLFFATQEATLPNLLAQSWHTCGYFARGGVVGAGDAGPGPGGPGGHVRPGGHRLLPGPGGQPGGLPGRRAAERGVRGGPHRGEPGHYEPAALPALDGGRILLLLVGEVWFLFSGQKLNPRYEAWIHAVGFFLLILLMVFVTFSDIGKLVE